MGGLLALFFLTIVKSICDFVICGIGITPNTLHWLKWLEIEIDNGIKTDKYCRTSDENIWSAGDCASLLFDGKRIRLESVQNAIDQAECVADNIVGNKKGIQPASHGFGLINMILSYKLPA